MPQLEKGGKWVFGWVIVDKDFRICIPREAWTEYGFSPDVCALFLKGSSTSGGFAITTKDRLPKSVERRELARGQLERGRLAVIPSAVAVEPWQRLLAVRGSGHALGFVARGPIYEAALRYAGIPESKPPSYPGGTR